MDKQKNDVNTETAHALVIAVELRVLIGTLHRRLREQAHPGDQTGSQKAVILHIERAGCATVTALAKAEGVRTQSIGATVSALEAAGLISGASHPSDGRQTILSITDSCKERLKVGRAAREDWLFRAIQTNFAAEEKEELAHAVTILKRLVAAS